MSDYELQHVDFTEKFFEDFTKEMGLKGYSFDLTFSSSIEGPLIKGYVKLRVYGTEGKN